jgi:PAS domain S-box-containing protein
MGSWLWTSLAGVIVVLAAAVPFVARQRQSQHQLRALNTQLQRSENDLRVLNADLERRLQARTAELRQQARFLRTLIDMLPMSAWFKDSHSRYLVVNQAHAEARGQTVQTMVGQSDQQLLPPELAQQQRSDDEEVMASRRRKTAEERVGDHGGGVWMETYKAPVLDEDGTVLGTVGATRNISERKAAEAARDLALSEATRLARQRSDFLAQMSHELRTPLNAILGFAHILRRDSTDERLTRGLRIIEDSGQHLLALINDILDLTRIDAAKLELFPAQINLPAFLQAVRDTIQVKAEEKSLLISYQVALDLPATLQVDEKRLRQVLLNLLSNAVKFTDSGRVTLRVMRLPPQGGTAEASTRLRFEVQDEGIGMTEEQLTRLFQPFEQVAEAKRRREGGSGLGLAISRQLIRLMGGDIEVRSRPGEGSVFSFEIEAPTSPDTVSAPPVQQAPIGYRGERRKVLVVDDVQQNRVMLLEELSALGFQVAEAADGEEAVQVTARFRPDLIVMDLMMPVMDGFEATQHLRLSPDYASLPIIATSASATPETEARARKAGANAFVGKPIQESVLLNAITALLQLEWIRDEAG